MKEGKIWEKLSLLIATHQYHSISTMCIFIFYHSTPSLPNSIYPFLPSSSTSFGRIIKHQWYLSLYIISNLLHADFAFNQVIPLEIVSFYSFSYLIMMHPKVGNLFCNTLFKGERRVEGNSNAPSSLQMSERVM